MMTRTMLALVAGMLIGGACAAQSELEKAPRKCSFAFVDGAEVVRIEVDGDDIELFLNEEPMPAERFERKGSIIQFRDATGRNVAYLLLTDRGGSLTTLPRMPHQLRLGVALVPLSDVLADHLGLEAGDSMLITEVEEDESGAKAGLERNDVIVRIDGESPATKDLLSKVLKAKQPGDSVELEIVRHGDKRTVTVELHPSKHGNPWLLGDGNVMWGEWSPESTPWQATSPQYLTWNKAVNPLKTIDAAKQNYKYLTNSQVRQLFAAPKTNQLFYTAKTQSGAEGVEDTDTEAGHELEQRLESLDDRLSALEKLLRGLDKKLK